MKKVYESIKEVISEADNKTPKYTTQQYIDWAKKYADEHGVPHSVVLHSMFKETGRNGDPEKMRAARNPRSGASGVMQIMPQYAPHAPYKVDTKDLFDPEKNIAAGVRGLAYYYKQHRNPKLKDGATDVNAAMKALASYNAGENYVQKKDKHGKVYYVGAGKYIKTGNPKDLPRKETRDYIADYKDDPEHYASAMSKSQPALMANKIESGKAHTKPLYPERTTSQPNNVEAPVVQDKPAPVVPKKEVRVANQPPAAPEVKPQVATNTENPYPEGSFKRAHKQAKMDNQDEFTYNGKRFKVTKESTMKNVYSVIGNILSEANTQRQNDKAGDSISREIEAQNAKLAQMQKMSSQPLPPGYSIQSRPVSGPDKKPEWGANLVKLFKGEPLVRVSQVGPGYEKEKPANYAKLQGKDGDLNQASAKVSDVSNMNLGDPYQPVSSKQAVRSVQTVKTANTSSNINATLSGLDHKALKSVVPSANAISSADVAKAAAILTSKAVSGKSESQPSAAASREIKAVTVPQSNAATVQVSPAPRANAVVVQQRSANVVSANNAPVQRSSTNTRRELTPFEKEFARARAAKETEFTWHDEKGRAYKVGTKLKGETNPPEVRTSGTRRRSSNIVRSNTSTNVKSEAPPVSKSDSVIVPDEEMKDIDAQIKKQSQSVVASDNEKKQEAPGSQSEPIATNQEDKPEEEPKKSRRGFMNKPVSQESDSNKTNEETQMSINKKFNVSDSLYTAVMEVMKKPSPGSTPRNEKEKKLASMHGDPDVITHGDILKARGVKMKEEVEGVDESSVTKKILDAADAVGSMFGLQTDPLSDQRKKEEASKNQANKIEPNKKSEQPKKPVKEDWVDSKGKFHKEAPPPGQVPSPDEGYRPPKAQPKTSGKKTQPGSTTKATDDVEESIVASTKNAYNKFDNYMNSLQHDTINTLSGKKPGNPYEALRGYGDTPQKITNPYYNQGTKDDPRNIPDPRFSKATPKTTQKESMDTPGNSYEHQCAIHVKSESFGEGRTITTQHADVDENGNIAWYDVMFEHGIERYVPTDELEILVSESHMHSMKKKKKVTEAVRGYVDSMTGARPPANQAERDTLAKEIKTNREINRSDTSTTGYGSRVTPQKGVESAGTGSARGPVVTTGDFERASPPQGTRVDPKATGGYGSQMKIPAGSGKIGGGSGGGMGTTDPFGRRGNPLKQ